MWCSDRDGKHTVATVCVSAQLQCTHVSQPPSLSVVLPLGSGSSREHTLTCTLTASRKRIGRLLVEKRVEIHRHVLVIFFIRAHVSQERVGEWICQQLATGGVSVAGWFLRDLLV
eukprot:m.893715 g.893715  ORF g.893715 m.893715 type:complete len:115 (+) comp23662_c1_seq16:271-615(+)